MKVWVIKYALTKGIILIPGRESFNRDGSRDGWFVGEKVDGYPVQVYHPKSWFPEGSFEEAKEAAKKLRDKKIQSLKKQITRLETFEFSKPGKE